MKKVVWPLVLGAIILIVYTQLSLFVVPPMGAVPEGRTIVMLKLNKMKFIDSADAMCERMQGGVSLLCRGLVLGLVAKNSTVLARLPYSEWLYLVSTGGRGYRR